MTTPPNAAPVAASELVLDLLSELRRDCERQASREPLTKEGRELCAAYAVVAQLLGEVREQVPLTN